VSTTKIAKRVGARIRAATPEERMRWKLSIRLLARSVVLAWKELPGDVLLDVGAAAMELIVKAKAGFSMDRMVLKTRQADPDVDVLITELGEEIALDAERWNRQGVELGSGDPAIPHASRGLGPWDPAAAQGPQGAAAGAAHPGPTLAPGTGRGGPQR
jgi:hypothetical protein